MIHAFNKMNTLNRSTRTKPINNGFQTLPAAARWLADSLVRVVTEADILQLALDRRLTISVKLETKTMAICSRVVEYKKTDLDTKIARGIFPDELKRSDLTDEIKEAIKKSFVDVMNEDFDRSDLTDFRAYSLDWERAFIIKYMLDMAFDNLRTNEEDQYLVEESYEQIGPGVYDLSMLGTEIVEVKRRNYMLTVGPHVDLIKKGCMAGTGVCLKSPSNSNGKIFKVQMDFDSTKCQDKSLLQLKKLEQEVYDSIGDYRYQRELQLICSQVAQKRMKVWQQIVSIDGFQNENFYPLDYLPEDSHLGVRSEALIEFERLFFENENENEKDNEVEKNTGAKSKPLKVQREGEFVFCIREVVKEFTYANGYAPASVDEVINRLKRKPPDSIKIEFLGKEVRIENSEKKPLNNFVRAIKRELALQKEIT